MTHSECFCVNMHGDCKSRVFGKKVTGRFGRESFRP